ncbi:MAG: NADH-quinone oxidoreductase subunit K [Firmicutes bacterium]|jgi:multicomponent Na+:H+ antiporter subunit C|nr:NADH-quinone oxidoreductase subunit K [Bacillota bacterium]
MITVNYIASALLVVIGLYAIITQKNLIKVILGMSIMDYGVNLFIVSVGYHEGGTAPIFSAADAAATSFFVDPVPQALTLTSIVIGACVDAMALSLVIKLYQQYKTVDAGEIRRLHG